MLALVNIAFTVFMSIPVSVKDRDARASHRLTDYRLENFCSNLHLCRGICNTLYLAELCITLKRFHMKKLARADPHGKSETSVLTDLGTQPRLPRAGQYNYIGFPARVSRPFCNSPLGRGHG